MSDAANAAVLPESGPAAPPRSNGELVFEAPWESRSFGLALCLLERGLFEWPEFQAALIAEIGEWERRHGVDETYRYYERWQRALERLLAAKGICSPELLRQRAGELAARPHGHDH